MHISLSKNNISLKQSINVKPLPDIQGESIGVANRIVGLPPSTPATLPISNTMASSAGMSIDFNKRLKKASQASVQNKKGRDENIKFVF
jgi:hypothetical protein